MAAHTTLTVNVVSAHAEVWTGQALSVVAKTTEGEIGILPGHTPVLAALGDGVVRVTSETGDVVSATAHGGFLSVADDLVTVLAGTAALEEA